MAGAPHQWIGFLWFFGVAWLGLLTGYLGSRGWGFSLVDRVSTGSSGLHGWGGSMEFGNYMAGAPCWRLGFTWLGLSEGPSRIHYVLYSA